MKRIIAGGTGFIGKALAKRWLTQGHEVVIIGRSLNKIQKIFGTQVTAVSWDQFKENGVHFLKDAEVIVNLAGANIAAKRWSEPYKQEIINSRVDATKTIADFCAELGKESPVLFNANGVGIYGIQEKQKDGLPEAINETKAIDETALDSFLQQVGWEWEQATTDATAKGVRVVLMRFGMVLGKSGGALSKMLIPFKLGLGGTIGTGTQPLSWIDLNDLCAAIDFLIPKKEVEGPVDFVSPNCVTQKQFAKALAHSLHRPCILPMPNFALKLLAGDEMATELLLEGQHVVPSRLLELSFPFEHPDIESALI